MDQKLGQHNSSRSNANIKIQMGEPPKNGERSNKCKKCDYASSQAGNLRRHLKTHTGEKSNKCSQCNFVCSQAGNLKIHVKTHSGAKPKNVTNVTMHPLKCTEHTHENTQRSEAFHMQAMQLCIRICKRLDIA